MSTLITDKVENAAVQKERRACGFTQRMAGALPSRTADPPAGPG